MASRQKWSYSKVSGPSQHYCDVCDISFESRSDWNEHKRTEDHRRNASSNYEKVACHICRKEFNSSNELRKHEQELSHRKMKEEIEIRKREKMTSPKSLRDLLAENAKLRWRNLKKSFSSPFFLFMSEKSKRGYKLKRI